MKFHEFGTENEKTMLILNGFGSCWARFRSMYETLGREYHVVAVAYDGFNPDEPETKFNSHFYEAELAKKTELKFEITACPYCKHCAELDCPELVRTFCTSDSYCYGNLPGVTFKRTQTLGTGGECCDFYFKEEG